MKTLETKTFFDYTYLGNLKSKFNKTVVTVSTSDEKDNTYHHNLYYETKDGFKQLSAMNNEADYDFLDADNLVINTIRDKSDKERIEKGEELTCFYRLPLSGGEATKLFELTYNVAAFEVINSDKLLMCIDIDSRYSQTHQPNSAEALKQKKADADYEVFDSIPFTSNGRHFYYNHYKRLALYQISTKELTFISDDTFDISGYNLNDNGDSVIYFGNRISKKTPLDEDMLYSSDLLGNKQCLIDDKAGYSISNAVYLDDKIMFIANQKDNLPYGLNQNNTFYLYDNGLIKVLADPDYSLWNSVGSDCRLLDGMQNCVYDNHYYFITTQDDSSHLASIDVNGHIETIIDVNGSIDCFSYDSQIKIVAMLEGKLQEVYNAELDCLSNFNSLINDYYVADYQRIDYKNDGYDLHGWVLLPKDYNPQQQYPAILDIHGGPKTVYGEVFYHEMQVWANMGYFVFFTNPRGSDGRGNDFMDIFGKYGTIDYDDLMKFTDVVLKQYPAIDPQLVGVTGGSYGGFMSNWIITHTNRFACCATQRSISNWISFYGTSDIGFYFATDQNRADFFKDQDKLWERSPLKYADNIQTPTLFIHSDHDWRCPIEQGYQLFTAMVDRGIEARFALFKGETHELSRSGKPLHRLKRLDEITNWMEKHLK